MPSLQTVERLVSLVEAGDGVEAVVQFYAEHASMQENMGEPRVGKAALLKYERAAQAAVTQLRSKCIRPILISENVVVIRWLFEFTDRAGRSIRLEELAYQHWAGEEIIREQFFYDPGQLS